MTGSVALAGPHGAPAVEYRRVGPGGPGPLLVFLHEGLGSVALWRDFPDRLCAAARCRGLVYSRPGYGRSSPRPPGTRWPVRFMHDQAALLPDLLAALDIDEPVWLFGHSDGGSIALIAAAERPDLVAGVVAVAPHIFVEDLSVASIRAARQAYLAGHLRAALARYHDDPDSAFFGWNDIWLDPGFRAWSLTDLLPRIACPVLAVQGKDDQYGTMAQIDGIAARVTRTELLKLAACGHSPQRDQPEGLIAATVDFLGRRRPPNPGGAWPAPARSP